MKALLLERQCSADQAPLKAVTLPEPIAGTGEIIVAVQACAACRTDLHVIEGELSGGTLPIVPGHQAVGRVLQTGPGCSRYAVGDRVGVAWLWHTCGCCVFCREGRENLCDRPRFTGFHEHGGYAECIRAKEDYVYPIPESLDHIQAAPLLCAGIIGYRALRRSKIKRGGRLALFGFGSSAHIAVQVAASWNCETFVFSRGADHLALAKKLGAAWTGGINEQPPAPVDSAIVFAPSGAVVPAALSSLKKGGTCALAGVYLSNIPELSYANHLFHEKELLSVESNTREDGRELFALAAAGKIKTETSTYPLEEANRVLSGMKHSAISGTAVFVPS